MFIDKSQWTDLVHILIPACLAMACAVMKASLWTLIVCMLSRPHITAGSIISAALNIELLDQDRSEQVRFIHYNNNLCSVRDNLSHVSRFKARDSGLIYFLSLWFMACEWSAICIIDDNILI